MTMVMIPMMMITMTMMTMMMMTMVMMMMMNIIISGRTVWTSGTLRQRSRRSSCTPLCQRLSLRCSCRPDDHNGDLGDEDDGDD